MTAVTPVRSGSIRRAGSARDIDQARGLFVEYARWLDVDLCFQDFDRELRELPGAYAPPDGRLLLAVEGDSAFGCIALRRLGSACGCASAAPARVEDDRRLRSTGAVGRDVGEVKRLYVQPARRGEGWGERLAQALIAEARAIGYGELKLDTLSRMRDARSLYARLGFRECPPYYDNPLEDAIYMSLALASGEST